MKNLRSVSLSILLIASIFLIACGAGLPANAEAQRNSAGGLPVEFVGPIETIIGRQWVIDGQTIQISDPALLNGNFQAGDSLHVDALVYSDGSVKIKRIEVYRVLTK